MNRSLNSSESDRKIIMLRLACAAHANKGSHGIAGNEDSMVFVLNPSKLHQWSQMLRIEALYIKSGFYFFHSINPLTFSDSGWYFRLVQHSSYFGYCCRGMTNIRCKCWYCNSATATSFHFTFWYCSSFVLHDQQQRQSLNLCQRDAHQFTNVSRHLNGGPGNPTSG